MTHDTADGATRWLRILAIAIGAAATERVLPEIEARIKG